VYVIYLIITFLKAAAESLGERTHREYRCVREATQVVTISGFYVKANISNRPRLSN